MSEQGIGLIAPYSIKYSLSLLYLDSRFWRGLSVMYVPYKALSILL